MSVLGVILGITAVIVLTGIGQGVKGQILDLVGGLGTNIVMVRPGPADPGAKGWGEAIGSLQASEVNLASSPLSLDDAAALEKDTGLALTVAPVAEASTGVFSGSNPPSPPPPWWWAAPRSTPWCGAGQPVPGTSSLARLPKRWWARP